MIKLFVYGSLKKCFVNNKILEECGAIYSSDAITKYKYPMYKSDSMMEYFPYLENTPGIGKNIYGEVWLFPHKKIEILDYFEGVPDLYEKGKIEVICENKAPNNKTTIKCLCYFSTKNNSSLYKNNNGKIDNSIYQFIDKWIE